MKLLKGLTAIVLLAVLAGAGARAQEEREREADDEVRMDRRIDIDLKKATFEQCMVSLRKVTGVNMVATQKAIKTMEGKPVTFALKKTPIWSAVHLFARSCGLEVSHHDRAFMFTRQVKPDEVWATLKLKIDGGKIEITILRADVPPELRRNMVRRLLVEELLEEHDDDDERNEEGQEEGGKDKDRDGDKKKPKKKGPAAKGDLF